MSDAAINAGYLKALAELDKMYLRFIQESVENPGLYSEELTADDVYVWFIEGFGYYE